MRTFLPIPSFQASAAVPDVRRLGEQRVEALQVLRGLLVPGHGGRRHPAVRRGAGHEEALVRYGPDACRNPAAEGRGDTWAVTLAQYFRAWLPGGAPRTQEQSAADGDLPPWLGTPDFHRSHRSALLRKDPGFHRPHFPGGAEDLPYVRPASDRGTGAAR
ncbi:MSMEG_6728 family protein [Streptomyces erythrochromogenes]|uniref:MSMEG_6728 family protein n=1 Tax=Streptomyces erythrochromogenes TaxID=285574 RepID=UPI0036C7E16B